MSVEERIEKVLLLEEMKLYKESTSQIGLKDTSIFRGDDEKQNNTGGCSMK